MTGLWLAAHAPDRISSLVVCCAAITPMPSRQSWLDRAALVIRGTSHLAPYQTPGPVTDAILGHLGVPEKLR